MHSAYSAGITWVAGAIVATGMAGCAGERVSTEPVAEVVAPSAAALSFTRISAGTFAPSPLGATCALTATGQTYCWGTDLTAPLEGTTTSTPTPTLVQGAPRFRQVSSGAWHACGLTAEREAYCWGSNVNGALGDGTTTDRPSPVLVTGGLLFRQVSASQGHTCGVTYPDNRIYCWGSNFFGQVGDGTHEIARPTPVAVLGGLTFRRVSVGHQHTCGIGTDARVYCWGDNQSGQLGAETASYSRAEPGPVAGDLHFVQLSAGASHTCGLAQSGRAFCWGLGTQGQIGDGKNYLRFAPRRVAATFLFAEVSAGGFHSCGRTTDGRLFCWGDNNLGQLGNGTTSDRWTPTAVSGGLTVVQVSTGGHHTCALTASAQTWCWGRNRDGIGVPSTARKLIPVLVAK